jgi:hypothetical protein
MNTTKLAILALLFSACADDPAQNPKGEVDQPDAGLPATPCGGPLTACGSRCVDLQRDSDNCAECGHSCGGTFCTGGLCAMEVLARGQSYPVDIAVAPNDVYWVNQAGTVMKLEKSDLRSGPIVMASNQSTPSSIALDQTNVYWTNAGTASVVGSVQSMPLGGGPMITVIPNQTRAQHVALAEGSLFWTTQGDGATPGTVMKASLSGGAPVALVSNVQGERIAVNQTRVYYATNDERLHFVPIEGGPIGELDGPTAGSIRGIALTSTEVYWATFRGLVRAPMDGSSFETLYAGAIFALAVDARFAYFAEIQTALDGTQRFDIRRLALDGRSSLLLAVNQGEPRSLAVDDAFVYWVNYKDGTVVRVAK